MKRELFSQEIANLPTVGDAVPDAWCILFASPFSAFLKIIFKIYFLLKFFIFSIDKPLLYGILKLA